MKKSEFVKLDTSTMKKAEMLNILKGLSTMKLDSNLLDRIKYTLAQASKSLAKVTNNDLREVIAEAQLMLAGPVTNAVPAETLKKSKGKKVAPKKVEEPVEDDTDDDDDEGEDEEPAPKKAPKYEKPSKKGDKKVVTKVTTASQKVSKSNLPPVAKMFPNELSIDTEDGEIVLVRKHEAYHSIDDIRKAIDEGKSLFIAAYWTKRHIKEYNYSDFYNVTAPKSFPDDLDVLNLLVTCDSMPRVWAMSNYTEAMYRFEGEDFEPVEDEDPADGSKFTVRVSAGLEFEVYELAE